eukprot:jgi/Galph1/3483/GphlegSOOS_G2183.1
MADVQWTDSFRRYEFQEKWDNVIVYFEVLKMKDSLYIWLGFERPLMKCLSVAFPTSSGSANSKLFGPSKDESQLLATRLAKRFECPVFVSLGWVDVSTDLFTAIERRLVQELKKIMATRVVSS